MDGASVYNRIYWTIVITVANRTRTPAVVDTIPNIFHHFERGLWNRRQYLLTAKIYKFASYKNVFREKSPLNSKFLFQKLLERPETKYVHWFANVPIEQLYPVYPATQEHL